MKIIIVFSAVSLFFMPIVDAVETASIIEQDKIAQIISAGLVGKDAKFSFSEEYTLFLPVGVEVPKGIQLGSYVELYGVPPGLTSGRNGDVIDYSLAGTPTTEGEYQMLAVSSSNGDRHYFVKTLNIQVGIIDNTPLTRLYQTLYTEIRHLSQSDETKIAQTITKMMYAILNDQSIQNGYNRQSHGYLVEQYLQSLLASQSVPEMVHQSMAQYVQEEYDQSAIEGDGKSNEYSILLENLTHRIIDFLNDTDQIHVTISGIPQSEIVELQIHSSCNQSKYVGVFEHIPAKTLRVRGDDKSYREVHVGTRLLLWDNQAETESVVMVYFTKDDVGTISLLLPMYGGDTYQEYLIER